MIVKTLNGMAAARPTVATPDGVAGIDGVTEKQLLVAPAERRAFAGAVVRLLRDSTLGSSLAVGGRHSVKALVEWEAVIAGLEAFLQEIVAD